MASTRIHGEDAAGVALALAAHVALVAWLVWMPQAKPPPLPERVIVTLSGEVGEQASAPSREAAAAAVAPVLAPDPLPVPAPAVVLKPLPMPIAKALPQPAARVIQPPLPKPQLRPAPAPITKRPMPKPTAPSRIPSDFLKDVPPDRQAAQRAGGASQRADDIQKGVPGSSTKGAATTPAASIISPQIKASLVSEVSRQLKPKWQQPDGVDVDKLATTIEWDLNPDGTLAGSPRFVSQNGVNSANSAQASRHREQAIRAVRLAAPFNLPPKFYDGWQRLRFTFDWKLN